MRELTVTLLGLALALAVSGCESTESESARLGREGAKLIAGAGTIGAGAANALVRVGQTALVQSEGRTAAAVQLTDTGSLAQVEVPVLIEVKDARGSSVYSNDIAGLEPSLQQMALLPAHGHAWWVDDQVLANGVPRSLAVRVGAARGATAAGGAATHGGSSASPTGTVTPAAAASVAAGISARVSDEGSAIGGAYIDGTAVNDSGVAQHQLPIFAVALRAGRVLAAGRALVPALPPRGGHASFRIYLVGAPAGASIALSTAPQVTG